MPYSSVAWGGTKLAPRVLRGYTHVISVASEAVQPPIGRPDCEPSPILLSPGLRTYLLASARRTCVTFDGSAPRIRPPTPLLAAGVRNASPATPAACPVLLGSVSR